MLLEIQLIKVLALLKRSAIFHTWYHCAAGVWASVLEETSMEGCRQGPRIRVLLHIPLHWFVFLSRIAFVDTIFPYLGEREKKYHVIIAWWRCLKYLNEHWCTHNCTGINQENKHCTPISHLDGHISPVLYNSRMCFPM